MKIVIIGSGMAGVTVAEELAKQATATGSSQVESREIVVLTSESGGYYSRPLLSHGFSRGDIEKRIVLRDFDALRAQGIQVLTGVRVTHVDRAERRVGYRALGDGGLARPELFVGYDRLVLATGSEVFVPPAWEPSRPHFQTLNALADLKDLRARRAALLLDGRRPRWAIVGGGLIGCEVAADLAKVGDEVVLVHATDRLMERQFTPSVSAALAAHLDALGIEVRLNRRVLGFAPMGTRTQMIEAGHAADEFDFVLVATGFRPRVGLAQSMGLMVKQGIVTDAELRTDDPSIYAVGDVAQVEGERIYAFVAPIRSQAMWLAGHLTGLVNGPWVAPAFKPLAKIHGFKP